MSENNRRVTIQVGRSDTRGEIGFKPPLDRATVESIPDGERGSNARKMIVMLKTRWDYNSDPTVLSESGEPYTAFTYLIGDGIHTKPRTAETDRKDLDDARALGAALLGLGFEVEIDETVRSIPRHREGQLFQ